MIAHIIHISLALAIIANFVSIFYIIKIMNTFGEIQDLLIMMITGISPEKLQGLINERRVEGVAEDTEVAE